MSEKLLTRREYLTLKAFEAGAEPLEAGDAVSSVAITHPEWDMDEKRTFAGWDGDR